MYSIRRRIVGLCNSIKLSLMWARYPRLKVTRLL